MWFVRRRHSPETKVRHSPETEAAIFAAFPSSLSEDVRVVINFLPSAQHEPHMDSAYHALVGSEKLVLPYRVYFPVVHPDTAAKLTRCQQAILAALMSRHHDGYKRELWARILCRFPAPWTVPFVAFLLGDYVIQVLRAADESLTPDWTVLFDDFAASNGIDRRRLSHRILTYWAIYYRYFGPNIRRLTDYPGYTLAVRLGLWDARTAPKLLRKARG
jgi:hypothetical protein